MKWSHPSQWIWTLGRYSVEQMGDIFEVWRDRDTPQARDKFVTSFRTLAEAKTYVREIQSSWHARGES